MHEEKEVPLRGIKSFVIRSSRMTKRQQQAWNDHWSTMGLTLTGAPLNFVEIFGNDHPVIVEIGFGMGSSLAQMAQQAPEVNFLGIEVHRPGVGALLMLAAEAELKNLKLFCADANEVLSQAIPNDSLRRIQLFFPDPWHKTRHNKRRLVQAEFIQRLRPKLHLGGVLHMATDWQPYAQHMLEVMEVAQGFANLAGPGCFSERPEHRPITKFEARGQNLGHGVWDLLYQRTN